jgi:hypothetical protein
MSTCQPLLPDDWFEQTVKPLMRGRCRLIRFADDFVIIFEKKNDADRVMAVISKRWLPPAQ